MSDKFEMFIKSRLEEGDFPSKAALAAVRAAAERRSAAGVFGVRVRLWGGALLAASAVLALAFSALFGFKGGFSGDFDAVEIIDLLSACADDDCEAFSDVAREERLLMWQDAPYEDIASEYAFLGIL